MKKLIAMLLCFMLLCCGLSACQKESSTPETTQVTAPQRAENALEFTVTDTDGNPVKLSDFAGKPVVLNFWATWCNPCTSELPEFEAAAKANPDIQFMMINVVDNERETMETALAFMEEANYTFPVFFDITYTATMNLGIKSIPTTIFIDADGNIVAQSSGLVGAQQLQEGIDMIYKGN